MIRKNPTESREEWMLQQFRHYGSGCPQNQQYQVWKHDNHPFWLESAWMIDQKTDYIHNNPVEAGFVNEPHEWWLSSANPQSPIKVLEM